MQQSDPSIVAQFNPAITQPAHRLWVDAMLFMQDSRGECLLGVVLQDRHGSLNDDWTVIEIGRDEMHRAAMDAHAILQGACMGVEAAIGGQ